MRRRAFLQGGIGAFAVAAAGRVLGEGAPSNRVRLAIMGCHAKGRGFALSSTAAKIPGIEIAVVCDVDARARVAAAERIKSLTGTAPDQALDIRNVLERKDIDGIICCAPDHWHAPAACMAMRAGKAVYVEKPCCYCPREGEILIETQKRTGMVFQMGTQRRSSPINRAAIAEIRAGVIGEPRYAKCWYMTRRQPIGKGNPVPVPEWLDWELWQGPAPRQPYRDNIVHYTWHWFTNWGTGECGNNATHYVDIARWALGTDYPQRVTSGGGRLFYADDDWAWFDTQNVTVEFPGNKCLTWEGLSSVDGKPYMDMWTGCMVYGLEGSVLFAGNDTCILYDNKGKEQKRWTAENVQSQKGNFTDPTRSLDQLHLTDYARCVRERDVKTAMPVSEGVKSTLLTHLGNIAQRTGETVWVDPATGRLQAKSAGADLWARTYAKGWELV
ncbi:MAG: Gfo/Idh/MocA family oxidoreductase [Kiritimatiellae bacterium]|nr:Gfo/Idh/MocA family oxidoreductase [Kiritimatiellia bacterium]